MAYNVLIVDDSNIVRKMLIKTFGMTSIPVSKFMEAGNGKEGLKVLEDNWVDIVFLDINMPVMNGMEFMEELRKNPDFKDLPVVVVSTEGSTDRIEILQQSGISAYVRKPATPEVLVETINEVLGDQVNE